MVEIFALEMSLVVSAVFSVQRSVYLAEVLIKVFAVEAVLRYVMKEDLVRREQYRGIAAGRRMHVK